jgi:C2 domain
MPEKGFKCKPAFKIDVQIFLSGVNLTNMDRMDESDPFCIVYLREHSDDPWVEFGRTETVDNNLNPDWVKHLDVSYEFHKNKQIRFEVLDDDEDEDYDMIGYYETTLAEIMMAPKQLVKAKIAIEKKPDRGTLIIRADQVYDCVDDAKLSIKGSIKSNKILCYGSDNPYVLIERARNLENNDLSFTAKRDKL